MSETMMPSRRAGTFLWAAWLVTTALGLALAVLFFTGAAGGMLRGDAVIAVDFSESSGWRSAPFRVWGRGSYQLSFNSINHDEDLAERHLTANFDVRILDADGDPVMNRRYLGEYLDHRVPLGFHATPLATLDVRGRPWRPGTLQVRVVEPDPAFRTSQSEFRLTPRDPLPVAAIWAWAGAAALGISLLCSVVLFRRGRRWPLMVSAASALLLASVLAA